MWPDSLSFSWQFVFFLTRFPICYFNGFRNPETVSGKRQNFFTTWTAPSSLNSWFTTTISIIIFIFLAMGSAPSHQSADRVQIFGLDIFGNLDSSGQYPTVGEEKNSNFKFKDKINWYRKKIFCYYHLIKLRGAFCLSWKIYLGAPSGDWHVCAGLAQWHYDHDI